MKYFITILVILFIYSSLLSQTRDTFDLGGVTYVGAGESLDNQILTLDADSISATLSIQRGNSVILTPFLDNTDDQVIEYFAFDSLNNIVKIKIEGQDTLYMDISGITLAGLAAQNLSIVGDSLLIDQGGSNVDLSAYSQDLSDGGKSGVTQTVDISGGSSVSFSVADNDNDPTNELYDETKVLDSIAAHRTDINQNVSDIIDRIPYPATFGSEGQVLKIISGGNLAWQPDVATGEVDGYISSFNVVGDVIQVTSIGNAMPNDINLTGWDTDASNDVLTTSTFGGSVSGTYDNISINNNSINSNKIVNGSIKSEDLEDVLVAQETCSFCDLTINTQGQVISVDDGSVNGGLYSSSYSGGELTSVASIFSNLGGNNGVGFVGLTDGGRTAVDAQVATTTAGLGHLIKLGVSEQDPSIINELKTATASNVANWNTAYSWGNHATQGYLTSIPSQFITSEGNGIDVNSGKVEVDVGNTNLDGMELYFSSENLYAKLDVSDLAIATPTVNDFIAFSDEDQSGDPTKKMLISTLQGLIDTDTTIPDDQTAAEVSTGPFNGLLSGNSNVESALQAVDNLSIGNTDEQQHSLSMVGNSLKVSLTGAPTQDKSIDLSQFANDDFIKGLNNTTGVALSVNASDQLSARFNYNEYSASLSNTSVSGADEFVIFDEDANAYKTFPWAAFEAHVDNNDSDNQRIYIDGNNLKIVNENSSAYNSASSSVSLSPYEFKDIQQFEIVNDQLKISLEGGASGNSVNLSPYLDNTDDQTLAFDGEELSISGGNTVDLASLLDNTDNQQLGIEPGGILTLTNSSSIQLPDNSTQNELQNLSEVLDEGAQAVHTSSDVSITTGNLKNINLSSAGNLSFSAAGSITSNKSITVSSDERYKEQINDLSWYDSEKFYSVLFKEYELKNDSTDRRHYGVIAQELKETHPELVYEDEDGMLSVNYTGLYALMGNALQRSRAEVMYLQKELDDTKDLVNKLINRIEKLENE